MTIPASEVLNKMMFVVALINLTLFFIVDVARTSFNTPILTFPPLPLLFKLLGFPCLLPNSQNTAVMVRRKLGKGSKAKDKIAANQFRKMNSDLFQRHGVVPAAQTDIMNRNASVSPFLRLPPEIRLQIYKLVLGGQRLWLEFEDYGVKVYCYKSTINGRRQEFDISILRLCRQVFTETALLPFALNKFAFQDDIVRRAFERSARPGKKRAQKKAIGEFKIMPWEDAVKWQGEQSEYVG